MPYVLDTDTLTIIPAEKIFRESDVKRLFEACNHIFKDEIYGCKNCYRSCHISIFDCRKLAEEKNLTVKQAYNLLRKKWEEENPEEAKKEVDSKMNWKNQHARNLRIIFGIAKRNDLYIKIDKSRPDTFEVFKNVKPIARICLF